MSVLEFRQPGFRVYHDRTELRTGERFQFVDLTEWVRERVRRSRVAQGQVNVQSRHTTACIVVNENEPLLLEDFREFLERLAPEEARYRHDDLERRTVHLTPDERLNGHAHLRALPLGCSETLAIVEGQVQLGPWQSIFLVELDGPRPRSVMVSVLGRS